MCGISGIYNFSNKPVNFGPAIEKIVKLLQNKEQQMADIDVGLDLERITAEIEKLIQNLQELDNQRSQLAQQIQQLQGVGMYLRGKKSDEETEDTDKQTPKQEE